MGQLALLTRPWRSSLTGGCWCIRTMNDSQLKAPVWRPWTEGLMILIDQYRKHGEVGRTPMKSEIHSDASGVNVASSLWADRQFPNRPDVACFFIKTWYIYWNTPEYLFGRWVPLHQSCVSDPPLSSVSSFDRSWIVLLFSRLETVNARFREISGLYNPIGVLH